MIWLYRLLQVLLVPLIVVFFGWRLLKGKEIAARWRERLGWCRQPRPQGQLIWLHGASVGETLSLLPLASHLRAEGYQVLMTSGTRTSAALVAKRAPAGVIHQFLPFDLWPCVFIFLRHWQPQATVFVESEFWPELLYQAPQPLLLNARISDKSFPTYQKYAWFFRPFLQKFKAALAQRAEDATRLQVLGVPNVEVGGNLKYDAPPPDYDPTAFKALQQQYAAQPVLVFASTHEGEEELASQMVQQLAQKIPNLLTVIVPRHPERGASLARTYGWPQRCKKMGLPAHGIYLADTLGELGLWYRLADVVVVGGSLVPHGGHNPLEPLKLAKVTLTGPHMFNFKDMMPQLEAAGMLKAATTLAELEKEVQIYLQDNKKKAAQVKRIKAFMPQLTGATDAALVMVKKYATA